MKQFLGAGEWVRRGSGVAVLVGVAAIGTGSDTGFLASISSSGSARMIEQTLLATLSSSEQSPFGDPVATNGVPAVAIDASQKVRSDFPDKGQLPSLDGAVEWLNSAR